MTFQRSHHQRQGARVDAIDMKTWPVVRAPNLKDLCKIGPPPGMTVVFENESKRMKILAVEGSLNSPGSMKSRGTPSKWKIDEIGHDDPENVGPAARMSNAKTHLS